MHNYLKQNERLDDLQINNLFIIQDPKGYCFTSDAVQLANFVKCKKGDNVVDLCSGSGVIGILINAKNNLNKVWLVEIQSKLADMSERSIKLNGLEEKIEVINKPLQNISSILTGNRIDCVVCNPPYKKQNTAKLLNESEEKSIARHEIMVTLRDIVKEASLLLKFGGRFNTIIKEERLIELINYCSEFGIEVKRIKILKSVKGANAVMVEGIKGGKSGCSVEI